MRIPTFRYMGGKARLRSRLVPLFPKTGRIYCECFAGTGNVYFLASSALQYESWILGDMNPFLGILAEFDSDGLPLLVDDAGFSRLKGDQRSPLAVVLEPSVTFSGKGYKYGFDRSTGNHVGYKRENYERTVLSAKGLLSKADIYTLDYRHTLEMLRDSGEQENFAYLDPPYIGTISSYPNIDHEELIDILNGAGFRWAVSGYDSDLYNRTLRFIGKYTFERNAEMKSSSLHHRKSVTEVLWTNY